MKLKTTIDIIWYWLLYHFCSGNTRIQYKNQYRLNKLLKNNLISKNNIYVLTYHSGEVFVFLELLRSAVNYGEICQNSLLIATKKYHIDLIEMLCPEMEYIYATEMAPLNNHNKKDLIVQNKNVHIVFPQFFSDNLHPYFLNKKLDISVFDKIKEFSGLTTNSLNVFDIVFDEKTKLNVEEKVNKYYLGEKFVFIAPEALTCQPVAIEFWKSLYEVLSSKGYDVFWNITKDQQLFNFGKSFDLSIKEANYLARRASGIISLRSGLSEQLAIIQNIPNIILYTDTWDYTEFPAIDAARMKQIYSLKKYSFTSDNIYEFVLQNSIEDLIKNIVKIITKE